MQIKDRLNRTGIAFHVVHKETGQEFAFSISTSRGEAGMTFTMDRRCHIGVVRFGLASRYTEGRIETLFTQFIKNGSPINYEVIADLLRGKHDFLKIAAPYVPHDRRTSMSCFSKTAIAAGITSALALVIFGITRIH
jgi:hypothetical protein